MTSNMCSYKCLIGTYMCVHATVMVFSLVFATLGLTVLFRFLLSQIIYIYRRY